MPFIDRRVITDEQCDELFTSYKDHMTVWHIGLYYGSMVYFEMGNKRLTAKHKVVGDYTLTLECDEWCVQHNETAKCDSHTITREFAETELSTMMAGTRFDHFNVDIQKQRTTLHFTNSFKIELRHEARHEMDQYHLLFSLRLPERKYISLLQGSLPRLELEIHKQD